MSIHKKRINVFFILLISISLLINGCTSGGKNTGSSDIKSSDSITNSESILASDSLSISSKSNESESITSTTKGDSSMTENSSKISNPSLASSSIKSSSVVNLSSEKLTGGKLTFETKQDSIIDVIISLPFNENMKTQWKDVIWNIDNSFEIPLSACVQYKNSTLLGSLYLKKGFHNLSFSYPDNTLPSEITNAKFSFSLTKTYFYPRLELSEKWMQTLYNPKFNGYVEAQGWEDMWTHCQYLPEKFLYASLSDKTYLIDNAKNAADNFIIAKMIQSTGAAHTVYRAKQNVYEQSIEPDMKQNIWDLWRGNAAAAEEMINCYNQFGDVKYLDKAKLCINYILEKWPQIDVDGAQNLYANLTDGQGLLTQSIGRLVMVLCQLYIITNDVKYKNAAIEQGKGILRSQDDTGLFFSSITSGWQHGNAYANAMLALGWLYKITSNSVYKTAIAKAFNGYEQAWNDDYGSLRLSGTNSKTGMSSYLSGRMAQGLLTCAYFTGEIQFYRTAEKTLYYLFGRNILNRDMQNKENGSYYYQLNYDGASNVETSSEINLGILQLYYLEKYWSKK